MGDAQPEPPGGPEKMMQQLLPILGSIVLVCMALIPVLAIYRGAAAPTGAASSRSSVVRQSQAPAVLSPHKPAEGEEISPETRPAAEPAPEREVASESPPLPSAASQQVTMNVPAATAPVEKPAGATVIAEPKSPLTLRPAGPPHRGGHRKLVLLCSLVDLESLAAVASRIEQPH